MLSLRLGLAALYFTASAALAVEPGFGVRLSSSQKQAFVTAVLHSDQLHIEEQLPRRLGSLHAFKPYFSMYELASTAFALVLEAPQDMSRWRALAKIAAYADGEYAGPYESARRKALARNPRLFAFCPDFQKWTDTAHRGQNI
jgi:hypothetical protein